jgi:peptidoglycan/LPS O-acetylase OafA/YrhL
VLTNNLIGSRLSPTPIIAGGWWNWQSVLWSIWEAVICVGLCVGLLVLFRDSINQSGKWQKFLAANAYAVYLIHLPIVIGIQFGFAAVAIAPLAKFLLVTLISLPICWGTSHLLRKLSFVGKIL